MAAGVRSPWVKWTLFPFRAAAVDHMSVSVGVCVGMSGRADVGAGVFV